jgi:hypothetical protein
MSNLPVTFAPSDITPLIERAVVNVRDDMRDNPYILEALRVLPVQGYRSAIGAFWNAVVDDLRNKIIFRSTDLFNKEMELGREIKTYEDFQNNVNDDQLIEGAYKIGVIEWEAYKILRHSKESRHIFYGHPQSSEPSLVKVLAVIDDCIKYVLNEEYPGKIIDIDEYIEALKLPSFDRNTIAISNAIGDLPETYKNQLANRFFTIYIHPDSSSSLISNIEFVAPLLWKTLPKNIKLQVTRRVDQEIPKGNAGITEKAFSFVKIVSADIYLSHTARTYKVEPLINELFDNLDSWNIETRCVRELSSYASYIPEEYIDKYVSALTQTYVGYVGSSFQFNRTDFYADEAAAYIPSMFQAFNDRMVGAFVDALKQNTKLKSRIRTPSKMRRLRCLGNIVSEKMTDSFPEKSIIEALVDEAKEEELFNMIKG